MTYRTLRTRLAAPLAAAALLALAPAGAEAQVRIAVVGPQTGPLAAFGAMMETGAALAAEAINARGGIAGEPLEILVRDDIGDPARARTVAGALVADEPELLGVIGHLTAGPSLEAAPLYADAGIPMITPAVTEPRLTEEPAWNVLRLAPSDQVQGALAAQAVAQAAPAARVAIVHDKTGFGKGAADVFRATLEEAGIVDVLYEGLDAGEPSYRGLAARVAAAEPDFVYLGGLAPEAALLLRDLRAAGSRARLVGTDALASPVFANLDADVAGGTWMTAAPAALDNPAATTIAGVILSQATATGESAESTAAPSPASVLPILAAEDVIETLHPVALRAYAAVEALADAASAIGTTDGEAIAARLREAPVDTALGPVRFDAAGEVEMPLMAVHEWRPGPLGALDYVGNRVGGDE
ncbi:branched-chain amino acid ABC transporter substrate-binding protein [Salinarimonas ramus]|uniref:Branched chain amino acid ABC transporter substrate-binding protein n=1 Tax=Salinarimonas ramus TaxID=690164 RepID=A0A917V2Q4_9HYPH|nr:branched-chain amino acid ABC transporter substrate-binding protein [Salinarimonas ramus]GGK23756.1 branched chain amino acid ABC transporter substrate-binding protein [Salinarimonas ramus]